MNSYRWTEASLGHRSDRRAPGVSSRVMWDMALLFANPSWVQLERCPTLIDAEGRFETKASAARPVAI